MKKFLVLLIFIVGFVLLPVFADVVPLSSKTIKYHGIGLLNMPRSYTVYQYPYDDAKATKESNYDAMTKSAIVSTIDMRKVSYVAYVPENNVAFLTVDLHPGNNWYRVFLNQETGETGWVYNDNDDDFYTYRRLFYKYGKQYGIRFYNDLDDEKKILYSQPTKKSQKLGVVKYPRHITFTVIQGNWLLGMVNEIGSTYKIGWMRWRNNNGTLNMFPKFKENSPESL